MQMTVPGGELQIGILGPRDEILDERFERPDIYLVQLPPLSFLPCLRVRKMDGFLESRVVVLITCVSDRNDKDVDCAGMVLHRIHKEQKNGCPCISELLKKGNLFRVRILTQDEVQGEIYYHVTAVN